jgi:Ala-tRNA(Pro) deacylase
MPLKQLKEFLNKNEIKYTILNHSIAYTAQEVVESTHLSSKNLAKCVIVKIKNKLIMVVLPAHQKVDLHQIKEMTGSSEAELASESEFQNRFPGCELGAMPPFGNLFDMGVYISAEFDTHGDIAFNAGTHSQLIQLAYVDYARLVKPVVISS